VAELHHVKQTYRFRDIGIHEKCITVDVEAILYELTT